MPREKVLIVQVDNPHTVLQHESALPKEEVPHPGRLGRGPVFWVTAGESSVLGQKDKLGAESFISGELYSVQVTFTTLIHTDSLRCPAPLLPKLCENTKPRTQTFSTVHRQPGKGPFLPQFFHTAQVLGHRT